MSTSILSASRKTFHALHEDSLFRNSFYLMLATGVMAGFGFFFWLISAHLVSPENIGVATSLISVMNIISIFSLIGFDNAIVRFLAHSTQRNDKLNTGVILVGGAAILLGTLFVVFVQYLSPQLSFLHENIFMGTSFVLFCAMSAINILTDAIFLAYRQTKFSLIINTIFSFIKMLLPLAFVAWGAFGIFSAAAVGQSIGFVLSIGVIAWKFEYRPALVINFEIIKEVWQYCAGNYIAGALNLLPITLLPLIITNHIGLKEAAYFYIVMMIGNLLYTIPHATTRSLFAESSYDDRTNSANIRKSLQIISVFLIPGIAVLLLSGKYILAFFGKSYSADGILFLYIIACASVAVSAYSMLGSLFRVRKNLQGLIVMNLFYAGFILLLSYVLLPLGLVGIGIAWFAGNIIACIAGYCLLQRKSV